MYRRRKMGPIAIAQGIAVLLLALWVAIKVVWEWLVSLFS
jgi:hypothetical protein